MAKVASGSFDPFPGRGVISGSWQSILVCRRERSLTPLGSGSKAFWLTRLQHWSVSILPTPSTTHGSAPRPKRCAVLCVPATCTALTAERRAQACRGALPGQGLTHLFSSGRGLCNARGLRVSGGGADQVCDPAAGQPSPAR